jgi:hypothetical protein
MSTRFTFFLLPLTLLFLFASCQTAPRIPSTQAAGYADIKPEDLRFILSLMARGHDQKQQLCTLLNLPLVGAETLAKPVFTAMAAAQSDLAKELAAWAKAHAVDLTFQFPDDVQNQAQKLMEDRQGKVILGDDRTDRTRDALTFMYADYEWQICLVETLLPKVHNPDLHKYLEHSLKVHQDGSNQIRDTLKRYKLP